MSKSSFLCLLLLVVVRPTFLLAQDSDKESIYILAIKADPNNETAHYNLGVSYLKDQKFDLAIPELQRSVQLNSSDNSAKSLLEICEGIVARAKGDYAAAIEHFQNVLKVEPDNNDAKRFLNQCNAKVFMDEKKYPQAVNALSAVIQDDPNNFGAYQNLGVIYFQQKDYKKAVDFWNHAVKIQEDSRIDKFLGFSYYNLGDFNNAIEHYNKSIALESAKDPKDQDIDSLDETYYDLGVAYNDNASYDAAADAFGKAFKVNPKDANAAVAQGSAIDSAVNAHMEKATNYLLNSQYSDAITEAKKVLIYQADNKQAQDFITDAQNKARIEDTNRNTVKKTERIKNLLAEGDAFYAAKNYSDAFNSYFKASKIDPHSSAVKSRLAKLKKKQAKDTDTVFEKAMKYYSKNNLLSAKKYFLEAQELNPSDARIGENLFKVQKDISNKVKDLDADGVSLFEGGDKENAKSKFEEVLQFKPNDDTANDYVKRLTGQQAQAKVDAELVKELYYEGVNLYINGKIHDAISKWQECLKQDPNNVNAQSNINKAMVKLQSIEKLSQN